MPKAKTYLPEDATEPAAEIVAALDKDVERGEDVLFFGFASVVLSPLFAPIAPPTVLLPTVALIFALTSGWARHHYLTMADKFNTAVQQTQGRDRALLRPIANVFSEHPMPPLVDSYNLLKNLRRTWWSVFGGILINPLWMPIFYVMAIQIREEENLVRLNQAVCKVAEKIWPPALLEQPTED